MQIPTNEQRLHCRERPAGMAVMRQQWADLLMIHSRYDAEAIQARLPAGLFVDRFDGDAWLGIVPFSMNCVRPIFSPPVPGISWFLELNVRTYVHDVDGTPGVWFFSLDCNQALAVQLARRLFHLPYEQARMKLKREGELIDYQCGRVSAGGEMAHYEYRRYESGEMAQVGSLEFFLLERYLLFAADSSGQIYSGQVHHAPYRFQKTVDARHSALPLEWDGFSLEPWRVESVLAVDTVHVEVFPLKRQRSGKPKRL